MRRGLIGLLGGVDDTLRADFQGGFELQESASRVIMGSGSCTRGMISAGSWVSLCASSSS